MLRHQLLRIFGVALLTGCGGTKGGEAEPDASNPGEAAAAGVEASPGEPAADVPGSCDPEKVTQLALGLAVLDARAKRDAVASELPKVCRVPSAVTEYIEHRTADDEARGALRTEATLAARQEVCPDAAAVWKEVGAAAPDQRASIIFERCDLDRFTLLGQAAFVAETDHSVIPFYAYRWLRRQSLPPDQARPLALALMLLGRHDWRRADQTLPTAVAVAPVPSGVAVHVTRDAIEIDDLRLDIGVAGVVEPWSARGHLLPPLYDVLARAFDESQERGGPAPPLLVVADEALLYTTVRDVVFTADRASLGGAAFVIETEPLEFAAVPVTIARKGSLTRGETFALQVTKGGFVASAPDGTSRRLASAAGDPWDAKALMDAVAAYKKANRKVARAVVRVDDGVPYGRLIRILASLRGPKCGPLGPCQFSDLHLEMVSGLAFDAEGSFDPDLAAHNAGILGIADQGEKFGVGGIGLVGGAPDEDEEEDGGADGGPVPTSVGGKGEVRPAKATVKGSLDKSVVAKVVKANLGDVRACYEAGLAKKPSLAGKVEVQFVIDDKGKVPVSVVANTTLKHKTVSNCIAKAVKTWEFPKPTGNVVVTYPFVLAPG